MKPCAKPHRAADRHFSSEGISHAAELGVPFANLFSPSRKSWPLPGAYPSQPDSTPGSAPLALTLFLVPVTLGMHQFWNIHDALVEAGLHPATGLRSLTGAVQDSRPYSGRVSSQSRHAMPRLTRDTPRRDAGGEGSAAVTTGSRASRYPKKMLRPQIRHATPKQDGLRLPSPSSGEFPRLSTPLTCPLLM